MKDKYNEIQELYEYCRKIGINATITPLYDGKKIWFPNSGDIVQHRFSYGGDKGCVEPAIGCDFDFHAVPLKEAKKLVKKYKDALNKGAKANEQQQTDASRANS